jgi:hypothetical protein
MYSNSDIFVRKIIPDSWHENASPTRQDIDDRNNHPNICLPSSKEANRQAKSA